MKVNIENLGAVKTADIEVGDLTIIAGENSTGKTKLVYAIWDIIRRTEMYFKYDEAFFKNKEYSPEYSFDELGLNNKTLPFEMKNASVIRWNIARILSEEVDELKINVKDPTIIFNKCNTTFTHSTLNGDTINIIYNGKEEEINFCNGLNCQFSFSFYNDTVSIKNVKIFYDDLHNIFSWNDIDIDENIYTQVVNYMDNKNNELKIKDNVEYLEEYEDVILEAIYYAITSTLSNNNTIEIATSERSGIISFLSDYKKVASQNNQFENPALTYNMPISKNVDFISGLSTLVNNRKKLSGMENNENVGLRKDFLQYLNNKRKLSEFENNQDLKENTLLKPVYEEIEKMIGGSLLVNQWGAIYFNRYDKEENEEAIHFNNLSSSIKNLTMIYFQLKYSETFATIDENTYYVIDEPEAFLHPMNQIKMARVLAMLVNHGVKVIVTTHSEYLIRELNALIPLGSNNVPFKDYASFNVLDDVKENMTLNIHKKNINIYTLNIDGTTDKQHINEDGINFNAFDSALIEQNKISTATNELVLNTRKRIEYEKQEK